MATLREVLRPDDLFVSMWLADELIVIAGDRTDIHVAESRDPGSLRADAAEFIRLTSTDPDRYVSESMPDGTRAPAASLTALLDSIVATVLPAPVLNASGHRRLLLFPDGLLAGIPLHLGIGDGLEARFPEGVVYAPSASAYAACAHKAGREMPQHRSILIGDASDQDLVDEATKVAALLGGSASIIRSQRDLDESQHPPDLLYVVSHGSSSTSGEDDWALAFDGGELTAGDIYSGRLPLAPGSLVVLSACEIGQVSPGPAHELEGFARALFYSGCANLIAARWPVLHEFAESIFTTALAFALDGVSVARALQEAVCAARGDPRLGAFISDRDAEPFFWGPYVTLGAG